MCQSEKNNSIAIAYDAEPCTIRISILTHGRYQCSTDERKPAKDGVDSFVSACTMHHISSKYRTKRQRNAVWHQVQSCRALLELTGNTHISHLPAVDAFVCMTVWNHIGKKYMMEKLQIATRKFEAPTRSGIFCTSKNGAITGSGATKSSMSMKDNPETAAIIRGTTTVLWDHCKRELVRIISHIIQAKRTGRPSL